MKNVFINFITLFLGFISFVFVLGFGLVFTVLLLVLPLIFKPFMIKKLKLKSGQVEEQRVARRAQSNVFEGKCERVCE